MIDRKVISDPDYGFLRLDPKPTQQEVEELYLRDFFSKNSSYFNNSSLQVQSEQSDYHRSRMQRILDVYHDIIDSDNYSKRTVFDIGCGFSQSLLFFHEMGFSVSGIEPSTEGVEYARTKNIDVIQCGVDNLSDFEASPHDLVLLINVLEHLRNPASALTEIREKLMHKNSVLVVEVPNDFNDFQLVANSEHELDEWWVLSPNHINYFSHNSIINILKKCGYKILYNEASFPLELFLLFGDNYIGNQELGGLCHEKRVRFETLMRKHGFSGKLNNFYKTLSDLGLGRTAIVYAAPA